LTVSGKGRRQEQLPLPHEVGAALLRYLHRSRPPLPLPEVFTSILAPLRPLSRAAPDWHQGADQWRSPSPTLRRLGHAAAGGIPGRYRRSSPSPLSQDDGSLCQGRL
jgi:hypothetical protein